MIDDVWNAYKAGLPARAVSCDAKQYADMMKIVTAMLNSLAPELKGDPNHRARQEQLREFYDAIDVPVKKPRPDIANSIINTANLQYNEETRTYTGDVPKRISCVNIMRDGIMLESKTTGKFAEFSFIEQRQHSTYGISYTIIILQCTSITPTVSLHLRVC